MNSQNCAYLTRLMLFLSFFLIFSSAPSFCGQSISKDDCLTCHEDFDMKAFKVSVHAPNLCTSCHNDIQELPHPDKLAKVNCATCHSSESAVYNSSDHGRAVKAGVAAANCLDCHGKPHAILDTRNSASTVFRLNISKTCANCHEDEEKMAQYNLLEKKPVLTYLETVHGKALTEKGLASSAVCTDCHGSHNLSSPANPKSKIYRMNVPNTCGKCHENFLNTYLHGIHGKSFTAGKRDVPVCTDCHGEHTIKSHKDSSSSVYSTMIAEKTCGRCHAAERIVTKYHLPPDRLETYFQSYHGLANKLGVTTVANCASCHNAHDILPSSDPNSTVYKGNLKKTCGKCHTNAGEKLAKGSVHLSPSQRQDKAVYYVTWFYVFLIVVTIFGMSAHNLVHFLPKFKAHYRRHKEEAKFIRFTRAERFQHFVLLTSFILLAYTGFALRYRDSWWALPFTLWNPGFDWRGIIHRLLAVVFSALCIYHVGYMVLTKRGKEQWKALLPKWGDIFYFFEITKYNLGLQKVKPKEAHFTYIEKVEYFALVWGSVVMLATGSMLTFENFFLRYFSKWVLDVAKTIHYYEAILAVLSILIWHLYFVILDPDKYPINFSMITGRETKDDNEDDSKKKQNDKNSIIT